MTRSSELVDSLLYEGYALYPYTPGATKNATPTPFGIVYPPAYAADARHDLRPPRAAVRGRGRRRGRAPRCASSRRAASATRRSAQRIEPATRRVRSFGDVSPVTDARSSGGAASRTAAGWVTFRVENRTDAPGPGSTAADALRRSLLSTHPVLRVTEAGASSRRSTRRATA